MTGGRLLAALLSGRQIVGRTNPRLLDWAGERWHAWLHSQRTDPPDRSKPQLFAVATLTCVEDLHLHVGLMQLLADPQFRCTVVLTAPTEEMARILGSQARREQWQYLVHIVEQSDWPQLIERLPASAALAVFPLPCVLTHEEIAHFSFTSGSQDEGPPAGQVRGSPAFIGQAGDYAEWNNAHPEVAEGVWAEALDVLRTQDPDLLVSGSAPVRAGRKKWPKAAAWNGSAQAPQDGIDVPAVEANDELVVRTSREPLDPTVIARRYAGLAQADEPLKIKIPGTLLITAPQVLRVEAHKADGSVRGTDLLFRVPASQIQAWMITAFLNRGGGGNPMIRAFAAGVGCRIAYAEDEPEVLSDIPVVWGVLRDSDRIIAQAKAQSLYFFYIDHAYFDRGHGKSYRITRNRYEAGPVRDCPPDRIAEFGINLRPWRKSGREIIVCPPTVHFMQAHGCSDWLETTLDALGSYTDRPIIIREKPQPGETAVPLETALEPAHALVTHSSNVAIEAACLGTPVFVNPASAAAPIGQTDLSMIETPVYPEREAWLAHLAYSQFSFDEIRDGTAWRLLLEMEERNLV